MKIKFSARIDEIHKKRIIEKMRLKFKYKDKQDITDTDILNDLIVEYLK